MKVMEFLPEKPTTAMVRPQVLLEATRSRTSCVLGAQLRRSSSCRHRAQVPNPHEVVSDQSEREDPVCPEQAAVANLPRHAHPLQPAEKLFDALPHSLTHLVSRSSCGAAIDCAGSDLVGDVGSHMLPSQRLHERTHVVAFVGAHSDPALTRNVFKQL